MGDTEEIAMVDLDLSLLLLVVRGLLEKCRKLLPSDFIHLSPTIICRLGRGRILAIHTRKEQLWVVSAANQNSANDWMTEITIQRNAKL